MIGNKTSKCVLLLVLFLVLLSFLSFDFRFKTNQKKNENNETKPSKCDIIYEVDVSAFADSDADGEGDLRGLLSRLDYIDEVLVIRCVLLRPLYAQTSILLNDSQPLDHVIAGQVLADFDALVVAMKGRQMSLLVELDFQQTSWRHRWFGWSAREVDGYADYYLWRKVRESAHFHWNPTRGQFYAGLTAEQPQLNWQSHRLRHELSTVLRFWLSKQVDGFRLHMDSNFVHQLPQVLDNQTYLLVSNSRLANDWLTAQAFDQNMSQLTTAGQERLFESSRALVVMSTLLLWPNITSIVLFGDELGLTGADVAIQSRNRMLEHFYRPVMSWTADDSAGFSAIHELRPWLTLGSDYKTHNVWSDLRNDSSVLQLFRRLVGIRRHFGTKVWIKRLSQWLLLLGAKREKNFLFVVNLSPEIDTQLDLKMFLDFEVKSIVKIRDNLWSKVAFNSTKIQIKEFSAILIES